MSHALGAETPESRAEGVRRAVAEYAATYHEVIRIAADGGSEDEISDLANSCFAAAVSLRLPEPGTPSWPLLRELYESLLVLSGVQRVADTLSLPVATCANGKSLQPFLDPRGELAAWYRATTGDELAAPEIPGSLVRRDVRDSSPTGFLRWPRRRLAANVDRGTDRTTRPADLTAIFAGRLAEALRAYGAPTPALARRLAPILIGFARLADRGQAGLRAPDGASTLARLLADGLVRPGARDGSTRAIDGATAPLRAWLAERPDNGQPTRTAPT